MVLMVMLLHHTVHMDGMTNKNVWDTRV